MQKQDQATHTPDGEPEKQIPLTQDEANEPDGIDGSIVSTEYDIDNPATRPLGGAREFGAAKPGPLGNVQYLDGRTEPTDREAIGYVADYFGVGPSEAQQVLAKLGVAGREALQGWDAKEDTDPGHGDRITKAMESLTAPQETVDKVLERPAAPQKTEDGPREATEQSHTQSHDVASTQQGSGTERLGVTRAEGAYTPGWRGIHDAYPPQDPEALQLISDYLEGSPDEVRQVLDSFGFSPSQALGGWSITEGMTPSLGSRITEAFDNARRQNQTPSDQ